jgi:hypothetical protein
MQQIDYIMTYSGLYRSTLLRAKNFSFRFPNNADGYNEIIDMAEEFLQTAIAAGAKAKGLPELPPHKK